MPCRGGRRRNSDAFLQEEAQDTRSTSEENQC